MIDGRDVETMAQLMYAVYCGLSRKNGSIMPRWEYLRHDLKSSWRLHAQLAAQAHAIVDGDEKDVVVPPAEVELAEA